MRTSHNQNHTENMICSVPEKNICMNVCQQLSESYENMIYAMYQSWHNHPILQLVDCSSQVPAVAFVKHF